MRACLFTDRDDARRQLAPAKSAKTDRANLFDLGDVIAQGVPVRLAGDDGGTVGGYVVQPFGRVLWITAAAGRAGMPLCPIIDAHASAQARIGGYEAVAFRTERRGLVKRTERLGYVLTRQDGDTYYMRKNIE